MLTASKVQVNKRMPINALDDTNFELQALADSRYTGKQSATHTQRLECHTKNADEQFFLTLGHGLQQLVAADHRAGKTS